MLQSIPYKFVAFSIFAGVLKLSYALRDSILGTGGLDIWAVSPVDDQAGSLYMCGYNPFKISGLGLTKRVGVLNI